MEGCCVGVCSGWCGSFDFCLRRDACSLKCCMIGSICVSLCKCDVAVSFVHPVLIHLAVVSMICSLCICVCDAIG